MGKIKVTECGGIKGLKVVEPTVFGEFVYKCSDFYHPNDEGGLIWNDPDIGVEWPIPEGMELSFSDKDTKWGSFKEYRK